MYTEFEVLNPLKRGTGKGLWETRGRRDACYLMHQGWSFGKDGTT